MKNEIHPKYSTVNVTCSCGNKFTTQSTIGKEAMNIDICSECHPFYTGEERILKTGAVDKFYARQKKAEELAKKK